MTYYSQSVEITEKEKLTVKTHSSFMRYVYSFLPVCPCFKWFYTLPFIFDIVRPFLHKILYIVYSVWICLSSIQYVMGAINSLVTYHQYVSGIWTVSLMILTMCPFSLRLPRCTNFLFVIISSILLFNHISVVWNHFIIYKKYYPVFTAIEEDIYYIAVSARFSLILIFLSFKICSLYKKISVISIHLHMKRQLGR